MYMLNRVHTLEEGEVKLKTVGIDTSFPSHITNSVLLTSKISQALLNSLSLAHIIVILSVLEVPPLNAIHIICNPFPVCISYPQNA